MKAIPKQFIWFGFVAALAGCSRATVAEMQQSSNFAAASGEVKVREEKNGNSAVTVKVEHLPPSDGLTGTEDTYVVWAQDDNGNAPSNLGALVVDNNRKGTLNAVTPLEEFEVYVTKESEPAANSPSGERVLWASVDRD